MGCTYYICIQTNHTRMRYRLALLLSALSICAMAQPRQSADIPLSEVGLGTSVTWYALPPIQRGHVVMLRYHGMLTEHIQLGPVVTYDLTSHPDNKIFTFSLHGNYVFPFARTSYFYSGLSAGVFYESIEASRYNAFASTTNVLAGLQLGVCIGITRGIAFNVEPSVKNVFFSNPVYNNRRLTVDNMMFAVQGGLRFRF